MKTKSTLSAPVIQTAHRSFNDSIPGRWFALGLPGILFISVCALLPSPAQAQCKRWDVSGTWTIRHADGVNFEVDLQKGNWQQDSANLTGTGTLTGNEITRPVTGAISGNITGNAFTLKVTVTRKPIRYAPAIKLVRRYVGTIRPDGALSGTVMYEGQPGSKQQWSSVEKMKCAEAN